MPVNGLGNYNYVNNYGTHHKAKGEKVGEQAEVAAEEAKSATETAASESAETTSTPKQKAESYKPDLDKIREMKADLKNNISAFKKMVYSEAKTQGDTANSTLKELLSGVAGMSQEDAAKAVADDGYWGVDATANRILDFAKALSGGDPAKIALLKDAVNKGFAAAGKVWGGDLPGISNDTLKKVMEGFDEWEKSGSADNVGSSKAAAVTA